MRLVTFRIGGVETAPPARAGALTDGGRTVVQLAAPSVLAIVEGGPNAMDRAAEALKRPSREAIFPIEQVTLLAPIPQPPQMRDFLCFEKHLQQAFAAVAKLRGTEARIPKIWYERPIYYHPNRFNVCGTGADVPWPAYSERMDFELEFGCYIGKAGKDIPRERVREHIFGYPIFNAFSARDEQTLEMMGQLGPGKGKDFDNSNVMGPCLVTADELTDPYSLEMKVRVNDFSARDEQTLEMMGQLGPGKGKDFDNSNVMGPCLVTADELTDPYSLEMKVRVNGEEWGRGNSRDMHWKFEDCIAHVSRSATLHPGEFFGSGTVGNGCGLEHMKFLKPGDVVELEVEGIGTLKNRVVAETSNSWGGGSCSRNSSMAPRFCLASVPCKRSR